MKVSLLSIAVRIGQERLTLEEVVNSFGKNLKKAKKNCGTEQLFKFGDSQDLVDIAHGATTEAINSANLSPKNISGIFSAGGLMTANYSMPDFSRQVGQSLGISDIPMMTINSGCVSGLQLLQITHSQLIADSSEGKTSNYLLCIGDKTSVLLNKRSWETESLFSDALTALILSNDPGLKSKYHIQRVGTRAIDYGDIFIMKFKNPLLDPQARYEMDGESTFEFAIKFTFPVFLGILGIDHFPQDAYLIPHQASGLILEHIIGINNLNRRNVYTQGINRFGNTASASCFIGLDDALKREEIQFNQEVYLFAFGAGLNVGAAHLIPNLG